MTLSQYFEIKKPVYKYYKVTPLKSLRNYNTDKLISVFASLSKNIRAKPYIDNKKVVIRNQSKLGYYIYIEKEKVEFYFIIPDFYETLMIEKITNCWKGITIDKVDSIPTFQGFNYSLSYKNNYCLSLATDKRSNTLLQGIINVKQIMGDTDKLCVFYNFETCEQKFTRADHDNMCKKYKKGLGTRTTLWTLVKQTLLIIYDIVFSTLGSTKQDDIIGYIEPLSQDTLRKRDSIVIDTSIVVSSTNKTCAVACAEAFKCVSEDNELKYNKCRQIEDYSAYYIPVPKNRMSCRECQNLVSLPAKELIEEYKIKCIDTFESKTPKELTTGFIRLGKNICKGEVTETYLSNDKSLRNLPCCICGSNQSGKTTYLTNMTSDFLKNGECVVLFDFCGKGEMSDILSSKFKNSLVINCADGNNLQGLGYNEIKPSTDTFEQYRNAKMQSIQLSTLINACNNEDKILQAKMDRYLESASLIVFINNGSIKNVFEVLMNYEKRAEWINKVSENQYENLEEYIMFLRELDDCNKQGEAVGTIYRKVESIIDRLNALKKNTYLELMLKKSCNNNFNLLDEIQKNQVICIRMTDKMFATKQERDIFCTYWFSKLWLALQIRINEIENRTKVNIIIDELYQIPKCQSLICQKLSQMPKYTAKLIVSCHYLKQISELREELQACNSSYMLLQGSNVSNFDSLKLEFENQGFTVDDLLNLKRYNSLNLISYEQGYWAGITALPPLLK